MWIRQQARFSPHSSAVGHRDCTLNNRSGLTLLEMVVALAILAIGIVSVLHAFSSSLTATRQAEDYTTAAILADQVASNLDSQSSITAGQLTGAFDDEPKYSWEADVEDADANGLMRTTITIAWSAGNNPRQYILVTDLLPSMSVQTVGTGGP